MRETLIEAVSRATEGTSDHEVFTTAVEGLVLIRANQVQRPKLVAYQPVLCVVLQGRKVTEFGDRDFSTGPGDAVFVGVDTMGMGRVVEASPSEPYLSVVIALDMATLREVLEEVEVPPMTEEAMPRGVFKVDFDGSLADCALRMVRLLDTPRAIPLLAPAIMREICYWLLTGPHGPEICRVARLTGPTRAIVDALRILRERYTEPLRVEELARAANMSPSVFHLRFKALTATTPLQYQKHLRLHEARRLLMDGETNVEAVAFQVGYQSPSQFSREYSRAFGLSPKRDAVSGKAQAL